ncbi:DUF3927 domain-containing protein [Bacteroides sp. 519]|nr:DUF3927 domain-containing protein [Bacteroides sp. 519]
MHTYTKYIRDSIGRSHYERYSTIPYTFCNFHTASRTKCTTASAITISIRALAIID